MYRMVGPKQAAALTALAAAVGGAFGCGTDGATSVAIDHLELSIAPTRPYYPVGDTVRATAFSFSADGRPVRAERPRWRALTPTLVQVDPDGLIRALAPGEATIEAEVEGLRAQVEVTVRGLLHHALIIDRNETWRVIDTPHVVGRYLYIGGLGAGTNTTILTIEPGVTVRFRPGAGLLFGDIEPGALVIPAGGDPVVMEGESPTRGSWVGLSFDGAGRSELRNLTIRHCGADTPSGNPSSCLEAIGTYGGPSPELLIDGVTISDAHDAVDLWHWCTLDPDSRSLSIENVDGHLATISPRLVSTFPRGGHFTGNAESELRIRGGPVDQSATWAAAGAPWRLIGTVTLEGPSEPTITMPAGLQVRADPAGGFTVGLGGLLVGDTAGPPVIVESTGQGWAGIALAHSAGTALRNVLLKGCAQPCLTVGGPGVTDSGLVLEEVTIDGARSAGIHLGVGVTFHPASRDLTIARVEGVPINLAPEAVQTIPRGDYRFNEIDAIRVRAGVITSSATWRNHGLPYSLPDGLAITSIGDQPSLTLEPGVTLQLGIGTRVSGGTLVAIGTPTAPITFTSATPGVPGSWVGIEVGNGENVPARLEFVEIQDAGAGPGGFGGALRLVVDPGSVLRHSTIRRSASCGIILLNGSPWIDDYDDPALGNSFIEVAGQALCQAPT